MENKERQILSEIMDMMVSLRSQIELLEAKVAELHQTVGQDDDDLAPIDLDIDDLVDDFVDDLPSSEPETIEAEPEVVEVEPEPVEAEPEAVEVEQESVEAEPEAVEIEPEPVEAEPEVETEPEIEPEVESEPEVEPEVESEPEVEDVKSEPEVDDVEAVEIEEEMEPEAESAEPEMEEPAVEEVETSGQEEVDDDLPFFAEPEPVAEPIMDKKPVHAVIDSMTDRQAWRTDMPGGAVKDIRSAISLNDRILFINILFGQDPMAFQDALTKINQLGTLDDAVQYIVAEHPEWDLGSETVYRFMMAVRRKIR